MGAAGLRLAGAAWAGAGVPWPVLGEGLGATGAGEAAAVGTGTNSGFVERLGRWC